jgi:hypothetical protein
LDNYSSKSLKANALPFGSEIINWWGGGGISNFILTLPVNFQKLLFFYRFLLLKLYFFMTYVGFQSNGVCQFYFFSSCQKSRGAPQ